LAYNLLNDENYDSKMLIMFLFSATVTIDGESSEVVFRLMNGRKKWQWIRGKIRMLYDKNSQPECLSTDNVLLK